MLLILIGSVSYYMLAGVVRSNDEAIENMEMIIQALETEVDHLSWTNELAGTFILEEQFEGELDYTQCNFGQWFYETIESEEFENTPEEFQSIFLALEDPHIELHNSASEIVDIYEMHGPDSEVGQEEAREVYIKLTLNQLK